MHRNFFIHERRSITILTALLLAGALIKILIETLQ